MPNDALLMLSVSSASIIKPGTMNAPKLVPLISWIREPIAEPKTTKYSEVERTGARMLWPIVRQVRAISNL